MFLFTNGNCALLPRRRSCLLKQCRVKWSVFYLTTLSFWQGPVYPGSYFPVQCLDYESHTARCELPCRWYFLTRHMHVISSSYCLMNKLCVQITDTVIWNGRGQSWRGGVMWLFMLSSFHFIWCIFQAILNNCYWFIINGYRYHIFDRITRPTPSQL